MGLKKSRWAQARQDEIAELDDFCRRLVKARDRGRCRLCNAYVEGRACQWAHIVERDYFNIRWDLENSLVLCQNDHYRYTLHKDAWIDVCEHKMGVERYRALRLRGLARTGTVDLKAWKVYLYAMAENPDVTRLPRPW